MPTFDFSAIWEIRENILYYLDNNDIMQEISLEQCRLNWIDYVNNSEDFTDIFGQKTFLDEKSRCVGFRDISGEKPFYSFFAFAHSEPVKFEMHMKPAFWDCFKTDWKSRHYKRFDKLQLTLQMCGYTTYDLS